MRRSTWIQSRTPETQTGMHEYEFTLYVRGDSLNSVGAEAALRRLLAEDGIDDYLLRCVDVERDPELAGEAKVMATPTLIRELPAPRRRLVGDLTRSNVVRAALGLSGLHRVDADGAA